MADLNRTNGMIWIDKNSPYRLKYHIHDEDYIVETAVTYKTTITAGATESLPVGTVVKLDAADQIARAKFPMDLSNVLGVILATEEVEEANIPQTIPVSVGKLGSIIIPKSKLSEVFVSRDLQEGNSESFKSSFGSLLGAPVYWDCGHQSGTDSGYTPPVAGKLTVQTPSGFKYHIDAVPSDPKMNIGYNNLPQVGNIINILADTIEIHLNFSTFDSTIEWYWPAIGLQSGELQPQGNTLNLYHGLFAPTAIEADDKNIQTIIQCPCKATAQIENNNNIEIVDLLAHFEHNIAKSYSIMKYSIPETLSHVYISGEVIYGFNKYASAL